MLLAEMKTQQPYCLICLFSKLCAKAGIANTATSKLNKNFFITYTFKILAKVYNFKSKYAFSIYFLSNQFLYFVIDFIKLL